MRFEVVRFADHHGEATAEEEVRDMEMQHTWCGVFDPIMEAFQRRGLRGDVVERTAPGAAPVDVVARETKRRQQRRASGFERDATEN